MKQVDLKTEMTQWEYVPELTDEISKCCSACFNRIARKLGTNPHTNEPIVALVPENLDGEDLTLHSHSFSCFNTLIISHRTC